MAYRIKKWNGIEMEVPDFSGKKGAPHESDLCEGCKAGHCSELKCGRRGKHGGSMEERDGDARHEQLRKQTRTGARMEFAFISEKRRGPH